MATNKMTERDLAAAGLIEDPEKPGQVMRLQDKEAPHEEMSLKELAVYIKRAEERADKCEKELSVERFKQGHGVFVAHHHPEMTHGKWGKWCDEYKIKRTTAWRAMKLYERAIDEWEDKALEYVGQHELTDLYVRYDIHRTSPEPKADTPAGTTSAVTSITEADAAEPSVLQLPQRGEAKSKGKAETVPEQEDTKGEVQDKGKRYKLQATVRIDSDMTPEKLHDLLLTDQVKWVLKNGNGKVVATVTVASVEGLDHA